MILQAYDETTKALRDVICDSTGRIVTIDHSGRKGDVLFRGFVSWTENEDSLEHIDIAADSADDVSDQVTITVRNGSPTVGIRAIVGNMRPCYPATTSPTGSIAVVGTVATDIFTAEAHGLNIGDAIAFTGAGGGVTAGVTYYVIEKDANTFKVSTARGGSAFDVQDTTANACSIVEEFFEIDSFTVPKWAAATSTEVEQGMVEAQFAGFPNPYNKGRIYFAKSDDTAGAFTAYVEVRRS
jgi:hypothetical protein